MRIQFAGETKRLRIKDELNSETLKPLLNLIVILCSFEVCGT